MTSKRETKSILESTFKTEIDSYKYQFDRKTRELADTVAEVEDLIKDSKFADERINVILEKRLKYADDLEAVAKFDHMLKELVKDSKLSSKEQKVIKKIKDETKNIQEQMKDNKALEIKSSDFSMKGMKDIYSLQGSSGLKDYISGKAKENFTGTNIAKGLLHSAGVGLDIPALNILASGISGTKNKGPNVSIAQEMEESFAHPSSSKMIDIPDQEEKYVNNSSETFQPMNKELNKLLDVNREMASTLELIRKDAEEYYLIQLDSMDDRKDTGLKNASIVSESPVTPLKKNEEEGSVLDLLDGTGVGKRKGGKGKSKGRFGKIGGVLKGGAGILGKIAAPLAAGLAVYDAVTGVKESEQIFDLKKGQESTVAQNVSAGLGSAISGLTFGLLNKKDASKSIEDFGGTATNFVRKLTTNDKSYKVASDLEEQGIVDLSTIGESKIRDMDAVRSLPKEDIDALIKYDDWSDDTMKQLKEISKAKSTAPIVDINTENQPMTRQRVQPLDQTVSGIQQNTQITHANIGEQVSKAVKEGIAGINIPAPIINAENNTTPVNTYNLESDNIMELLMAKGLR